MIDNACQPTCPFCGLPVARPREQETHRPNEMPVGACSCGAVYACDVTGHNLGAAFIEALVFGCNGDWDLAWGLLPEEDYLEKLVENYDYETHLIFPGGFYEGRKMSGALYFIKLHPDVLEFTHPGVQKKLARAAASATATPAVTPAEGRFINKKLTRQEIKDLVMEYQLEALLDLARTDSRLVRELQRLLCSGDALLRFRAADILGQAAAVIAARDQGSIARLLQGLLTSVTDPGASAWGAVDAAGAIIASAPKAFAGYVPALYQLLAPKTLRPLTLRALGRIAAVKPELVQPYALHLVPFLHDPDAEVRGYAAWLLGNIRAATARRALEGLRDDGHSLPLYTYGSVQYKTVGQLAREALAKIEAGC